jgi:hypothetical protein
MEWQNEATIREFVKNTPGFEPDPSFVQRLHTICLEELEKREKRRKIYNRLYRVGSSAAIIFLATTILTASHEFKTINWSLSTTDLHYQENSQLTIQSSQSEKTQTLNELSSVKQSIGTSQPHVKSNTNPLIVDSAKKFLAQVIGSSIKNYRVSKITQINERSYEVTFTRLSTNNLKIGITVVVTPEGKVTKVRVHDDPNDLRPFVDSQQLLSREKVIQKLESLADLQWVKSGSSTVDLVYTFPVLDDIDAQTGTFVDMPDDTSFRFTHPMTIEVDSQFQPFTASNREELATTLEENMGIAVQQMNFKEQRRHDRGYRYVWEKQDGTNLIVETALHGQILSVQLNEVNTHAELLVNENQARNIVYDFLSKHLNRQVEMIRFTNTKRTENGCSLMFRIHPVVDNIPVSYISYDITVDLSNGIITGFQGDFLEEPVHDSINGKIISARDAVEELIHFYPMELVLIPTHANDNTNDFDFIYHFNVPKDEVIAVHAKSGKILK